MAQWVTTDGLKDALTKFRVAGDSRWASRDDVPTDEAIAGIVEDVLEEADIGPVAGLTDSEVQEVIDTLEQ